MIFTWGGFTIYGGLIFGILTSVVFVKHRAVPILPMPDAAAPSLMLDYAIGRIGCKVSGDGDWRGIANMELKPDWMPDSLWTLTYNGNIAGILIAGLFGIMAAFRSSHLLPKVLFSLVTLSLLSACVQLWCLPKGYRA